MSIIRSARPHTRPLVQLITVPITGPSLRVCVQGLWTLYRYSKYGGSRKGDDGAGAQFWVFVILVIRSKIASLLRSHAITFERRVFANIKPVFLELIARSITANARIWSLRKNVAATASVQTRWPTSDVMTGAGLA